MLQNMAWIYIYIYIYKGGQNIKVPYITLTPPVVELCRLLDCTIQINPGFVEFLVHLSLSLLLGLGPLEALGATTELYR